MTRIQIARFAIGQIVRHRDDAFSGVVLDVDAAFAGPDGMTGTVPVDQPYYRVLALGPECLDRVDARSKPARRVFA